MCVDASQIVNLASGWRNPVADFLSDANGHCFCGGKGEGVSVVEMQPLLFRKPGMIADDCLGSFIIQPCGLGERLKDIGGGCLWTKGGSVNGEHCICANPPLRSSEIGNCAYRVNRSAIVDCYTHGEVPQEIVKAHAISHKAATGLKQKMHMSYAGLGGYGSVLENALHGGLINLIREYGIDLVWEGGDLSGHGSTLSRQLNKQTQRGLGLLGGGGLA